LPATFRGFSRAKRFSLCLSMTCSENRYTLFRIL
jgi:hypothetical protein